MIASPPADLPRRTRHLWTRPVFSIAIAGLVLHPARVVAGQGGRTPGAANALQEFLAIEDSRTTDADSLRTLSGALTSPSPQLRALGARAAGRFERSAFLPALRLLVADEDQRVRLEAVNAIAQIARSPAASLPAAAVSEIIDELTARVTAERDAEVRGTMARSLGRIARRDSSGERVQRVLAAVASSGGGIGALDPRTIFGVAHGMYALARTMRQGTPVLPPDPGAFELQLLQYGVSVGGNAARRSPRVAAEVRRLALLTLSAAGAAGDSVAIMALRDPDDQVRRLAVLATTVVRDSAVRRRVLASALGDDAFIVRFEAVRSWRRFLPSECGPLVTATRDRHPQVMLAGIDALGGCTNVEQARAALEAFVRSAPGNPARAAGRTSWHPHARALVSLARLDASRAAPVIRDDAAHPIWQVRMYAARAAALVRDTATLARLAFDSVGGVREAALDGLSATSGHVADGVFTRALSSEEHHVVLAAAQALKGAPVANAVLPPLIDALDRLTRGGQDNSRDPRMELLQRIGELGDTSLAARIAPYVTDFDVAVADRAAAIVSRWTGRSVAAAPRRVQRVSTDLARVANATGVVMRFTMAPTSGGGSFTVRLRTSATPATAQRLIASARRGYYNGLTFHRVEPTFVIQGGSPRATEYVGDGPFMRDEVDLASHVRGSMGISTRGRDTGDAQVFVNLTDNFRLDHDYTVFGDIVDGMSVVDGILEGDVIASVTVRGLAAR